jgi:hypothetical protein
MPRFDPDFLSNVVALANFMRLSLLKAAHAAVGECRIAGNPGSFPVEESGMPGRTPAKV